MNSRIRELLPAPKNLNPLAGHPTLGFTQSQMEEFAELIIRECVRIGGREFLHDNSIVPTFPSNQILEHFGVEMSRSNENSFGYIIDPGPASSKEIQDARNDCLDGTL